MCIAIMHITVITDNNGQQVTSFFPPIFFPFPDFRNLSEDNPEAATFRVTTMSISLIVDYREIQKKINIQHASEVIRFFLNK